MLPSNESDDLFDVFEIPSDDSDCVITVIELVEALTVLAGSVRYDFDAYLHGEQVFDVNADTAKDTHHSDFSGSLIDIKLS